MADLYEWHVKYSKTESDAKSISCEMHHATVYAESEAEARQIMDEEYPGFCIDSIAQGDLIDDA